MISNNSIIKAENIEEIFEEIGYILIFNEDVNTYEIDYMHNEKLGDEQDIFNIIAPYIPKDLYLEYNTDDGNLFRYVFDGHNCVVKYPKIIWVQE